MMNTIRIAIAVTLLSLIAGCKGSKKEQTTEKAPDNYPVITLAPMKATLEDVWVGTVDGTQNAEIRAKVEGYLSEKLIDEGDFVKKGELLFKIEDNVYQNDVISKDAKVASAEAKLERSIADVERLTPLAKINAVSKQELDYAIAEEKANKAALNFSKTQLNQSRINLSYTTISSPVDGIVGKTPFKVGSLVGKDQATQLTIISKIDEVYVYFSVLEAEYISFMKYMPGNDLKSKIEGMPKVAIQLPDNSVYEQKGKIEAIDRSVNATTGGIQFRARFPNPDQLLRPGTFVRLKMKYDIEDALLIPQESIYEVQGKQFVFQVASDNTIESKMIETNLVVGRYMEVTKGLKQGDKVVAVGLAKLRDGMTISPEDYTIELDK